MHSQIADPLLRAQEVADLLKVSIPTIYRRMADGSLPKPVKLGAVARWPQSEIIAAVKAAGERRTV
ncbi:helix-turn-helix transcriptional regulator [Tianweitania sp.]|uniref:helix-turn-helix transcriptional regulator n=1 Tax=Tianweitania sp. TaxID=2021634 RepID=UPI0028A0E5DB|nr:helix-turn-helix domain-containing protein [Tianweitania sp.]